MGHDHMDSDGMELLRVDDVDVSIDGREILHDVNFQIDHGEFNAGQMQRMEIAARRMAIAGRVENVAVIGDPNRLIPSVLAIGSRGRGRFRG